jgi:hypothetical protein
MLGGVSTLVVGANANIKNQESNLHIKIQK